MEIINKLLPYKKIILVSLACLIALFAIWWFFDWLHGYLDRRDIEENKKAVENLQENANGVKQNLENLRINEAIRGTEVNVARNAYNNSQAQTDEARNKANQSLLNVNAIEASNYSNKTLEDAKAAQCRAFWRPGCPK